MSARLLLFFFLIGFVSANATDNDSVGQGDQQQGVGNLNSGKNSNLREADFQHSTPPSFVKTPDGIMVYTDPAFTGKSRAVKLEVLSPTIIRVIASPNKTFSGSTSLVTIYKRKPGLTWDVIDTKEKITLKTSALRAEVEVKTGTVTFYDLNGKRIFGEQSYQGRQFTPAIHEGKSSFGLEQQFRLEKDDAIYGLGQHQDGVFNYRGEQVNFFQNNTEVAVPFMISVKNYGVLWDNYSLTRAGDLRDYKQLSALQLSPKVDGSVNNNITSSTNTNNKNAGHGSSGITGWLSATYYNDKDKPEVFLTRAESSINMEWLGDYQKQMPSGFNGSKGKVVWEGSISNDLNGAHKFRFVFGGYLKVWIDGKLQFDRWRESWNPAPSLLSIDMKKGEKFPIKIEWIPEGNESYLAVKWLEPVPAEAKDLFGFSSEAGQQVDYYFIHGKNMDEVIAGYRTLTGKAPIMPKWSMGFWQSRERYKTQQELMEVVKEFRERKIPLDNIVLDWSYWKENAWGSQEFDEERFPSPDAMIDSLHDLYNTKIMISVWPKFYEGITAYNEFDQKGWLYKRNIADRQRDWIGKGYTSTFYDAFSDSARKGFWKLIHDKIYTKGIDAWWMDASEPDILSNVDPQKRKLQMAGVANGAAAEYINAYPLQNAKGIYEGQRSADPDKRVFLLTRSGFAGSQRYAAAIWSGDIGATWHDLKMQIPAGVNFSMSGIPYWTMDIGGFVVERKYKEQFSKAQNASQQNELEEEWRELNTRWFQFGAFVPLFRSHGQFPFREIYNIAPEDHAAYKSMLYYNKLRYKLLPYIYSLAGKTYHEDYTMMRGLVMDFSTDTAVQNISDQYMFGPSLLINPVYQPKQTAREVYLPATSGWYDFYSGEYFKGGRKFNASAPYERMPVFVKEGSILPFGPDLLYTAEKPADTISLFVYAGKDAAFTIYEDEGNNYDYEKGKSVSIPINYNVANKTLTIDDRKGSFEGMLQQRVFRISIITPYKKKGVDTAPGFDREVIYTGKKLSVKL
jgi:alpha-D-xyloside xylohydrolase